MENRMEQGTPASKYYPRGVTSELWLLEPEIFENRALPELFHQISTQP